MARTSKRYPIEAEIARLPDLGLTELRKRWVELYATPVPKCFGRGLLLRAVAYQVQMKGFGGLSETTKQRLRVIAAAARDGTFDTASLEPRIKPGTRRPPIRSLSTGLPAHEERGWGETGPLRPRCPSPSARPCSGLVAVAAPEWRLSAGGPV